MPEQIDALERQRRQAILRDIRARQAADGIHMARAHPERARQFMPFAALKGYEDLVRRSEDSVTDPTHLEFEDYA